MNQMAPTFTTLAEAAAWYRCWLKDNALPLWSSAGHDAARGNFHEALGPDLTPATGQRRSRVQTRQCWVFASVAALGWPGPYAEIAAGADSFHRAHYRRPDGLFAYAADPAGTLLTDNVLLYDQAFAVLAWAALQQATGVSHAERAREQRTKIQDLANPAGGYREFGAHPFQANAHMHLLEASLAWEEAGDASWRETSDGIVDLACRRFIDPQTGILKEFFDADWRPIADTEGGLVEPGHQFEWAWLLDRWARIRDDQRLRPLAERLYANGLRGVGGPRKVAVGALWSDGRIREMATRVWPQTEWLKAALVFGSDQDVLQAAQALAMFLDATVSGLWQEKMSAEGTLSSDVAPATSLYHITGAALPLLAAAS